MNRTQSKERSLIRPGNLSNHRLASMALSCDARDLASSFQLPSTARSTVQITFDGVTQLTRGSAYCIEKCARYAPRYLFERMFMIALMKSGPLFPKFLFCEIREHQHIAIIFFEKNGVVEWPLFKFQSRVNRKKGIANIKKRASKVPSRESLKSPPLVSRLRSAYLFKRAPRRA